MVIGKIIVSTEFEIALPLPGMTKEEAEKEVAGRELGGLADELRKKFDEIAAGGDAQVNSFTAKIVIAEI